MKIYRNYVGKLSWLASNTRPDLAVYVMNLARKQKGTEVKDLRDIDRVLKKVKEKENKLLFG